MAKPSKAVVLSSGGLDSTTVMGMAQKQGYRLYSLTFDYGQRHRIELDAAARVAKAFNAAKHMVIHLDLRNIGGSALTDDIPVPKTRNNLYESNDIPVTYVPARNTIFLSYALAWAEVIHSNAIFIGVNALDYSGYPDCRPEFIRAFEHLANLATRSGVQGINTIKIHTPLIQMTKAEIIRTGTAMGIDFAITHSCYDPVSDNLSCGQCDSCRLRLKGFSEAGLTDPLTYASGST